MKSKVGDKVRIKTGEYAGLRAVVRSVYSRDQLEIQLDSGDSLRLSPKQLTNFSLAARKAWRVMPSRKVGRRIGSKRVDNVTVTFRIDRQLWQLFLEAEARGDVASRNEVISRSISKELQNANYG